MHCGNVNLYTADTVYAANLIALTLIEADQARGQTLRAVR